MTTPLSIEIARQYGAEIENLSAMIRQTGLSANAEGRNTCSYAGEKVAEAKTALEQGDIESAWFHLFGAATFCQDPSQIQPEKAERALVRIDSLLR